MVQYLTWDRKLTREMEVYGHGTIIKKEEPVVPLHFFLDLKNLIRTEVPVLIDDCSNNNCCLKQLMKLRSLRMLKLKYKGNLSHDSLLYVLQICLSALPRRIFDIELDLVNNHHDAPLKITDASAIHMACIDDTVIIHDRICYTDNTDRVDSLRSFVGLVGKYRNIKHFTCLRNFTAVLGYTSLANLETVTLDDLETGEHLRIMLEYTFRNKALRVISSCNVTMWYDYLINNTEYVAVESSLPIIDRKFSFRYPVTLERVPVILHCFPALDELAIVLHVNETEASTISILKEMLLSHELKLIFYLYYTMTERANLVTAAFPDAEIHYID